MYTALANEGEREREREYKGWGGRKDLSLAKQKDDPLLHTVDI